MMNPPIDDGVDAMQAALMAWWEGARVVRDCLPWRSEDDPWRVLVAETMLAQTQAERVRVPYAEFTARFPSPDACAQAPRSEVLRAWAGLGYYRRAVSLHRTAGEVVTRFGGVIPSTLGELMSLPGIGPYTGRAVLAFAHGVALGAIDTNIRRVLVRAFVGEAARPGQLQLLADELAARQAGREWNLALMDLGHLVCLPAKPHCELCPLKQVCRWRSDGSPGVDPAYPAGSLHRRQGRFEGSDRQARGRILRAVLSGAVAAIDLGDIAGWPDDHPRALNLAEALVADGVLEEVTSGFYALAQTSVCELA